VTKKPASVEAFLKGRRFAVAGVSRDPKQPANAIVRKLRTAGYEVVPINPHTAQAEGEACYPNVRSIPGAVDGVVIATHPDVALDVVRDARDRGVRHVWFHRSFGRGSVAEEAAVLGRDAGMNCIVGGCPLMYCEPVDLAHRCMCWWLGRSGRVPT
jgi:predicted CoA-binding protein